MAEFLKNTQLLSSIEELIEKADQWLWLISPYIKFHERIKECLRQKKDKPSLHIVVIFGKNEEDISKSLSKEDFDFLKEFPSVTIGYEKRLHAKYYASEDFSIITSMNLHEFSQNNNIEVGIKLRSKMFPTNSADSDAGDYFEEVVQNCTVIFEKEAQFTRGLLGFGTSYSHSEITTDQSENFFKKKEIKENKYYQRKPKEVIKSGSSLEGFCIRTGKPIPFDLKRPMCFEAYQSWNQFKNPDFAERFCHKTGKPSYGKTSMRSPVAQS